MLNLNDDMDDLIRQAADEYPLKTDAGKDWDKVLGGLQSAAPTAPAKTKKYWWLLLLLLPLLLAIPVLYKNNNADKLTGSLSTKATDVATTQKQNEISSIEKNEQTSEQKTSDKGKIAAAESTKSEISKVNKEQQYNDQFVINKTATSGNNNPIVTTGSNAKTKSGVVENKSSISDAAAQVANATTGSTNQHKNSALTNNDNSTATNDVNVTGATSPKEVEKLNNEQENTALLNKDSSNSKNVAAATASQKDSTASVKKTNIKHTTPVKIKGLYVGVAASLDATTVKMHKIDKIGYTTSFLVGYRFNNNWSVETGLMLDDKKYYSPGKYFDKTKTGLSTDYNVHFLNGYCKMFEIPVDVKYDFRSKKLSGFYIVAGLSSYIMRKEHYNYYVTHYSSPAAPGYFGERNYKNSTNNFISVANISGGYQFVFKNSSSFRIEPYFKVPLSGLGIGKLPFSSTGISAAYTLPVH